MLVQHDEIENADASSRADRSPAVAVLNPEVSSKIAAGECVERPASVVKEVVENALDAGATRITVELEDGGRSLIRVIDNGVGMLRQDLVLAVQRHATSKLRGLEDLDRIQTLGFRGEALPSIAAVSRLEIVSCMNGETPNRLILEGCEITDLESCGSPVGTTVTVRDLFWNTPARQKFLRSGQTEFGHALEHLTRLAIAHHHVAFRVVNNGRESLNTPGSADPLNAIVAAYGPDTASQMAHIDYQAGSIRVHGYVSRPALTRATRAQQSFFVNRRWIRSRTITHALDQGYRTLLTVGRQPVAAILIETPAEFVDVNVHPTKAEVRFVRDHDVHQAVARAVRDGLMGVDLVPQAQVASEATPTAASSSGGMTLWNDDPFRDALERRFQVDVPEPSQVDVSHPQSEAAGLSLLSAREQMQAAAEFEQQGVGPTLAGPMRISPLIGARVVGQLHLCYIAAESEAGILLIDQHAAHERILYEKFLARRTNVDVQQLIIPLNLELGSREAALLTDRLDDFRVLGFDMEPFGPTTFLVRTAPLFARRLNHEELLQDLVDELAGAELGRKVRVHRERIAASMACRAAVKQGDSLSMAEMESLVKDLCSVDDPLDVPTNCPHGRPTTILLTLGQVERLFRRT